MSLDVAHKIVLNQQGDADRKLEEAAFLLRQFVLSSTHKPIPDYLKVSDVLKGEVKVHEKIKRFFTNVLTGPVQRKGETLSEKKKSALKRSPVTRAA